MYPFFAQSLCLLFNTATLCTETDNRASRAMLSQGKSPSCCLGSLEGLQVLSDDQRFCTAGEIRLAIDCCLLLA